MNFNEILVAMPAYNEEEEISKLIDNIKKEGFKNILVVDDCSTDRTPTILKNKNIFVIRHSINRGAGAATGTAIEFAKRNNYSKLVLLDADGQHSEKDIKKLLKHSDKFDIIIGSRIIGKISNMPIQRIIANIVGSIMTKFFFGKFVWDSQSGFKILNKKAINEIELTFDRYEFCSELIGESKKKKLSVKEIPIKIIYSANSLKKGQSITNGFKMILKFILK